ncbi:MAG: hypothetical protein ABWY09_01530 [Stenotrophomonas maltophilia]
MNIANQLVETIKSKDLQEVVVGALEAAIDSEMAEGILKEIPFFGSLISIGKAGISIRDRIFARKLEEFISSFSELSWSERSRIFDELGSTPELQERAALAILDILERCDPIDKPRLIGNLFVAMVRGHIPSKDLLRLCTMITGVFPDDLQALAKRHKPDDLEDGRRFALQANGFLVSSVGVIYTGEDAPELVWAVSQDGLNILKNCFDPVAPAHPLFDDVAVY